MTMEIPMRLPLTKRRSSLRVALFVVVGLVLGAVFAPVAHAQNPNLWFTVPQANKTALGNWKTETPFAEGVTRFQQVCKASEVAKSTGPVRLTSVSFRSASSGQTGGLIEVAITVGLLNGVPSRTFDQNLQNSVPVFPRKQVQLPNSAPGAWVLNFPFQSEVVWDGTSDLVVDVRVYGNFNNNKRFFYDFDGVLGPNTVQILTATTPNASTATATFANRGLVVRFDYVRGITYGYGNGCKGDGNVVPQISTSSIPKAGDPNFLFLLSQAKPQSAAVLLWGFSRDKWGALDLPLDLTPLGIWGCDLNVAPDFAWPAPTTGSSPGTGTAAIQLPLPPASEIVGVAFWAQWAVLDDSTSRPLPLALTPGLALVIGG